jgi:hypothetical protein
MCTVLPTRSGCLIVHIRHFSLEKIAKIYQAKMVDVKP